MEFKDYYAILGVSKKASNKDIQKAFRKLAREHHPDVNKGKGAEVRFKEIGEAYDVLKDPEKRAKYDRYGAAWKAAEQGRGAPPGFEGVRFDFAGGGTGQGFGGEGQYDSFFDLLDQMFGGRTRARSGGAATGPGAFRWAARGQDHEAPLRVTLEEAEHGTRRRITLTDPDTGAGRTYSVNVPAGSRHGQRIRLSGQGGDGHAGGASGDLYLVLSLLPHDRFRLEGLDLHGTLPVTPWEAALGAEVEVTTLDGAVRAKIPAGTSSGRRIRLKGKGFQSKTGRGDLYMEIRIEVPKSLTQEERRLYKELSRLSQQKPDR